MELSEKERILKLETQLDYIKQSLDRIEKKLEKHGEDLSRMKTETRLIAGIVSGGLVFIWEIIRRKLSL